MFRIPKTTMPVTIVATKKPKQMQTCLYSSYECSQPCLEGYTYCAKHILEDPNAPFKQCGFVYNSNGRKCQNPAPKLDRRDILYVSNVNLMNILFIMYFKLHMKNLSLIYTYRYCTEHARKAQIARIKSTARHSLPQTPEMLLLNLSHYVKKTDSSTEDTEDEEGKIKALDPFSKF